MEGMKWGGEVVAGWCLGVEETLGHSPEMFQFENLNHIHWVGNKEKQIDR